MVRWIYKDLYLLFINFSLYINSKIFSIITFTPIRNSYSKFSENDFKYQTFSNYYRRRFIIYQSFLIVFRKKHRYIPSKQHHVKIFINNSSISVFTENRWTTYQKLQKQTNVISTPDSYPEVAVFHTLFKSQSSRFHPPLSKIQTTEVRNLWKSNKRNSDSLNHRICGRIDSSLVSLLFFSPPSPNLFNQRGPDNCCVGWAIRDRTCLGLCVNLQTVLFRDSLRIFIPLHLQFRFRYLSNVLDFLDGKPELEWEDR